MFAKKTPLHAFQSVLALNDWNCGLAEPIPNPSRAPKKGAGTAECFVCFGLSLGSRENLQETLSLIVLENHGTVDPHLKKSIQFT